MLRFSIFGFPVRVDPMFWVFTALLGGGLTADSPDEFKLLLIWVAVVFVSILWHELGHCFAMKHFGDREPQMLLYAGGGLAFGSRWRSRTEDIIVSLAGPAAGLFLAFVVFLFDRGFPPRNVFVYAAVEKMWFVNFWWSLINLLPVIPLDGGRVTEALLGPAKARQALTISLVVAIGAAVFLYTQWGSLFAAVMFGLMAFENWRRLKGQPPATMMGR